MFHNERFIIFYIVFGWQKILHPKIQFSTKHFSYPQNSPKLFCKAGIVLSFSIWVCKRKVPVYKCFPCTSSLLFWVEVFVWKFLNEVGPKGQPNSEISKTNTKTQKWSEQVQGNHLYTWTCLYTHNKLRRSVLFLPLGYRMNNRN